MRIIVLGLILPFVLFGSLSADDCDCPPDRPPIGPEFKVHGRIGSYNGGTTFRIWIVGTKRLIAIPNDAPLPKNLDTLLTDFEDEVFGDFVLCPVTKYQPGVMQMACVKSASHLVKRRRS